MFNYLEFKFQFAVISNRISKVKIPNIERKIKVGSDYPDSFAAERVGLELPEVVG